MRQTGQEQKQLEIWKFTLDMRIFYFKKRETNLSVNMHILSFSISQLVGTRLWVRTESEMTEVT